MSHLAARTVMFIMIGGIFGLLFEAIIDVEAVLMFIAETTHDHIIVVIGMIAGCVIGLTSILNAADAKTIRMFRNKKCDKILGRRD